MTARFSPGRGPSGSQPTFEAHVDLVRDGDGDRGREAPRQSAEERAMEPDRRGASGDPGGLRRKLDRAFEIADLVDEAERDGLLAQPDLAGIRLSPIADWVFLRANSRTR